MEDAPSIKDMLDVIVNRQDVESIVRTPVYTHFDYCYCLIK